MTSKALSGKDKAAILGQRVADVRRRNKLSRMKSFDDSREREALKRHNQIYAKFQGKGAKSSKNTLRRTKSEVARTPESKKCRKPVNSSEGDIIISGSSSQDTPKNITPRRLQLRISPHRLRHLELNSSPIRTVSTNPFQENRATPESVRKVRIPLDPISPIPQVLSSPLRHPSQPKPILKNTQESPSRKSMPTANRDLTKSENWNSGEVILLDAGSPDTPAVVVGCTRALEKPEFDKMYEALATLNHIAKINGKLGAQPFFILYTSSLFSSTEKVLEATAKGLISGLNAFESRTSIQALKLLKFLVSIKPTAEASVTLSRTASLLDSPNLSKGIASAALQLIGEMATKPNILSATSVEQAVAGLLNMRVFNSTTVITEKLMVLKRFLVHYHGVMTKISYTWLSHVFCCIINTEVPGRERIANACIYVLQQFAGCEESKDVVFTLLNENLNDNVSSIKSSTLTTIDGSTAVVDALAATLIFMIYKGWGLQALKIWTHVTYMIGCRHTSQQVDLDNWVYYSHWVEVFDNAMMSDSEETQLAALDSWRAVIFDYQCSRSFHSKTGMEETQFQNKMDTLFHPLTWLATKGRKKGRLPGTVPEKIIEAYSTLYCRIYTFLRSLSLSSTATKTVDTAWIVGWVFTPFNLIFRFVPELTGVGVRLLTKIMQFSDAKEIPETPLDCYLRTSAGGWSVTCLPKHLLLTNYDNYFEIAELLLSVNHIPAESKAKAFDTLVSSLQQCTRNAIISQDAVGGFVRLVRAYFEEVEKSRRKPSVQYLAEFLLSAKSIFGLRILTDESASSNLITIVASAAFQWHTVDDFNTFVQLVFPFFSKNPASLFYGIGLLEEDAADKALVDTLSDQSISLTVFAEEFDVWKRVFVHLDLLDKHFPLVVDKVIEYQAMYKLGEGRFKDIEKFMSNLIEFDTALSADSWQLLLTEYSNRAEKGSFVPLAAAFNRQVKLCSDVEFNDLCEYLSIDKCPYMWYKSVLNEAISRKMRLQVAAGIVSWVKGSVPYIKEEFKDRWRKLLALVEGSIFEGCLIPVEIIDSDDEIIEIEDYEDALEIPDSSEDMSRTVTPKDEVSTEMALVKVKEEPKEIGDISSSSLESEPIEDLSRALVKRKQSTPTRSPKRQKLTKTLKFVPFGEHPGEPNNIADARPFQPVFMPVGYMAPENPESENSGEYVDKLEDTLMKFHANPNLLASLDPERKRALEDNLLATIMKLRQI